MFLMLLDVFKRVLIAIFCLFLVRARRRSANYSQGLTNKNQVMHFWFRGGEHFFVVPEEQKRHLHQGTELWVPNGGKVVVFVYDQGKLIEDPGFILSHKKLASGAHYTKVSYFYGVYGEKAFQGSSLKRNQVDQNAFTESLWKSFFKDKTAGLYQYFVPASNLGGADDSFFDLLNDEGFGDFIKLLPVHKDAVADESIEPRPSKKHKKARKKHLTVQNDAKQLVFHQSVEDSKQEALVSHDRAEFLETGDVQKAHAGDVYYEQIGVGDYKPTDQKTLALLENIDLKATKWRDFWNFVNSVIKSLPEKPEVRCNRTHYTFSFRGMPSITIAQPDGNKHRVDPQGLRDFHDWLQILVKKVCGLDS